MDNRYNNCKNKYYEDKCCYNYPDYKCECKMSKDIECGKFKEKSDELYLNAKYIQEDYKRLICESEDLYAQSRELELKAKELCSKANMTWDKARKLELEYTNLLDLASFYCNKATECYKNCNNSYEYKPTCNSIYEHHGQLKKCQYN